eukprot:COSAG02_NODE_6338_length_3640_cov_3.068060_1_plen_107_part_00
MAASSWGGFAAAATAGGLVGAGLTCAILAGADREAGLREKDSFGGTPAAASSSSRAKMAWNRALQTIVAGVSDQTREPDVERQWIKFFQVSGQPTEDVFTCERRKS